MAEVLSLEEALPGCWESIQTWVDAMGNMKLRALSLDEDEEYQRWLQEALGQAGEPKSKKPRMEDWGRPGSSPVGHRHAHATTTRGRTEHGGLRQR